jgi:AcrR family transcriptional regulator
VLSAAIRVFAELGYRRASLRDLAEAVGLSKPALYHYFNTKEELLVELYRGVLSESIQAARAIAARDLPADVALREILIERVVYTCENRRLLRVFFEEEAELPGPMMEEVRRQRREYEDVLVELVEQGARQGLFVLRETPRILVNTMLGAANWVYKWYNPSGKMSPKQLGASIADYLLAGIRPQNEQ